MMGLMVYCRVGGLEMYDVAHQQVCFVYCRVGGLETSFSSITIEPQVYCRVGGLEINNITNFRVF